MECGFCSQLQVAIILSFEHLSLNVFQTSSIDANPNRIRQRKHEHGICNVECFQFCSYWGSIFSFNFKLIWNHVRFFKNTNGIVIFPLITLGV